MAKKSLPDPAIVRKILRYDPETGKLYWLKRPLDLFCDERSCILWNARHAGKEALTSKNLYGYLRGTILDKPVMAHRVIWVLTHGEWPDGDIDHINGNRSDNRLVNLRVVTRSQNLRNQRRRIDNKSGVVGVFWVKDRNRWHATIIGEGKDIFLGSYDSLEEAAAVRREAEKKYGYHGNHGETRRRYSLHKKKRPTRDTQPQSKPQPTLQESP